MATDTPEPCPYPFGENTRLDVHPGYRQCRSSGRLTRVTMPYGGDAWLATTYADVKSVLTDPRLSRAATVGRDVPRMEPVAWTEPSHLALKDPPEHTRLRKLLGKGFTPAKMEEMRPRVQGIVDGLLDDVIEQGPPADLVQALALPLPMLITCELLGVAYEDRDQFRSWVDTLVGFTGDPTRIAAAREQLSAYVANLVDQRRRTPSDDLFSALVQVRDQQDLLSEAEVVSIGKALLVTGRHTTANHIGNFLYVLLTHPKQLDRLRAAPDLLPTAIEELLRYTPLSAAATQPRVALEDVRIGPVQVRAGDTVLIALPSANRDDDVFEDPDELDLERRDNPHIAFGFGPHYCPGAQLARVELQVAVGSVLRRLPGLHLAVPEQEVGFLRDSMVRGLTALPVAW